MTRVLTFGSGTSTKAYPNADDSTARVFMGSQRASVAVTLIRHLARTMFSQKLNQRVATRQQIIRLITKARDPGRCIDKFLQLCSTEGGPDGLDAAIDVLSKTGPLIMAHAWDYLQRDLKSWGPTSERPYQPNDDYWYALLRSVGRTDVSEKERFRFISCCSLANARGIREGVVEALRDLGTPGAKERLRRYASEDGDLFIRQIAQEALDDLES